MALGPTPRPYFGSCAPSHSARVEAAEGCLSRFAIVVMSAKRRHRVVGRHIPEAHESKRRAHGYLTDL
jgi:hypothetical protein